MIYFLWKVGDWFLKWKGGVHFTCASTVFPFGKLSHPNLPPQGSLDHLQGGYVRGLWEDMFLSYKGSARESLVGHLLRDGCWLEEGVPGQ